VLFFINISMTKRTIEELRQQQAVTRGASEWTMLEEEIQEMLDEEENE